MKLKITFPDGLPEELQELMRELGTDRFEDVFNRSLAVFEWVFNERLKGNIVVIEDETLGTYKEIDIELLRRLARQWSKNREE